MVPINDYVDLFPATYRFQIKEEHPPQNIQEILEDTLKQVVDSYDYIFLDAQAGSDFISRAAMSYKISNEVVLVTEYDPLSAAGIERLKVLLHEDLTFNRTWILLNKMLPEFVENFSEFMSVTRYLTPIPWNANVVRAYSRGELAIDLERGNDYTISVMQTLKMLFGKSISQEIDEWANNKANEIKKPINRQYEEAEKELGKLLEMEERKNNAYNNGIFNVFIKNFGVYNAYVLSALLFAALSDALINTNTARDYLLLYYQDLNNFNNFNIFKKVSLFLFLLWLVSVAVFNYYRKALLEQDKNSAEAKLNQYRIDRQKELLNERLSNLEVMKKADIKTLMEINKNNINNKLQ